MTRGLHFHWAKPSRPALLPALALACLLAPAASLAQDAPGGVGDFKLPPGSTRPATPAQGPVDEQVPVVRPTREAPPEPSATPTASPAPQVTPTSAAPVASPSPRVAPRPRATASAPAVQTGPTPQAAPLALPTEDPAPATSGPAIPAPVESAPATAPASEPAGGSAFPMWLLGGIVAIGLLGALAWLLRNRSGQDEGAYLEPEPVVDPTPEPIMARPVPPPPAPPVPPVPAPVAAAIPTPVPSTLGVTLTLEAHHLSRSLIYVTLAYRLTVANPGPGAIGPLRISGDLTSAHASQSQQAQLNPAPGELEHRHELARLEPGESAVLTGEMRLPVAAILPIRQGAAQLFVPLARFGVTGHDGAAETRVFVVGQPGEQPGDALRPFRIDAMPGVFRELAQREIAVPA